MSRRLTGIIADARVESLHVPPAVAAAPEVGAIAAVVWTAPNLALTAMPVDLTSQVSLL